jgi:ABC-type transport system involved in multi-copper enzyme maturation permease subunit
MNPLVKKEIRLLLPSWGVAMLLALVQAILRPFDFYVACLLFFGLTIMALTTFGRETSLGTFSLLLAQPAERLRIWQTKLSVLAVAFLTVFVSWIVCFFISRLHGYATNDYDDYNLFITLCLIATATFTGGLWTTLLLRQLAGAFWLTLLVPAVLSGVAAGFLAQSESSSVSAAIAVLCVVFAVYSVGGFLFARRLFFHAQDVGWSGGVISLPEWKFFAARSENAVSARNRRPISALIKKEFQLHQASLTGAAGLLVLHVAVIVLRKYHHFPKDSAGEILTIIVWMPWLVMAPVIGSLAVAEERRLGVIEGQLCLPVSRRVQFAIKGFLTLLLCIFLGGVMPVMLEAAAVEFGAHNPMFTSENGAGKIGFLLFPLGITAFSACMALVSFYASTLAKSFLQAVGLGIAIFFICCALLFSIPTIFHDSMSLYFILLLIIAVPTLIATLSWLAYLNFENFRDGWPLWRRNLLGFAGAVVFAIAVSMALYHRAWEVFEPAEPPHGPAKLSLGNPPAVQIVQYRNLLVRLPDGRVWFDFLEAPYNNYDGNPIRWRYLWQTVTHPVRESAGPQQFIAGSNWVAATTERMYFDWIVKGKHFFASGFMETIGIRPDGTLWVSEKPEPDKWSAKKFQQYGGGTGWRQLAQSRTSIVLLKRDGTLWRWGSVTNELHQWPGLRAFTPRQIGTNSDWQELSTMGGIYARQADGRVWHLNVDWKTGDDELDRMTNYDGIVLQTTSHVVDLLTAFVRADGTLWVHRQYYDEKTRQKLETGFLQVGKENDWRAVAVNDSRMVALKSDGSLWQWRFSTTWNMTSEQFNMAIQSALQRPPVRLGIHNDWIALANTWGDMIALAADGSLWLWPDRDQHEQSTLLKLPKQPEWLGNVFGKAE